MFFVAKMTHRATETLIRHRSLSESAMAWRMSLLVATDAACWVPIIGLGLWSLAGFTVPPQVFAWVAVFVLPLNAAVNPVLYTLSAVPIIRRSVVSNRRAVSLRRSVTNDPHRTMSTTMVPPSVQYNGDKVTFSLITKIPHSNFRGVDACKSIYIYIRVVYPYRFYIIFTHNYPMLEIKPIVKKIKIKEMKIYKI
ncbi:hypothetical protein AGLY_008121 [Aphis glycines]|uniref:G-protein coupled receptors family 1 profile domain-containing protein n=1 Tax=Aphis glycines TaxID=307491 RepID=A0A6G0TL11_APHGL|nr:hypothetical protein AGLY_008121 [Aphis glycines]